ncbi:MAG: hypothetical protein KAV82_16125 [Phycisphaerae bacterium]|nr:hypothetical protein [Phycisphaerae bacterium]
MKTRNITPPAFDCGFGLCPSIHETDRDTYLIVGKPIPQSDSHIDHSNDEVVVEVPRVLLDSWRCSAPSQNLYP